MFNWLLFPCVTCFEIHPFHMCSNPVKFSLTPKKEVYEYEGSKLFGCLDSNPQKPIDISSSSSSSSSDTDTDDDNVQSSSKQLVLYEPPSNDTGAIGFASGPIQTRPPSCSRDSIPRISARVLPSVAAFTVQCASCFKWRLIPTKEKYEEIREHITEQPFYCKSAREWKPDVSCDDPEDISQDGSRLWAIDKPNIAQPPPGWQRLLRIRGEGSTKFADIYYVAPSGKRLRSIVEIQKYLLDHPEYIEDGVTLSRFSFQIPRPLQEDYVRKRSTRLTASSLGSGEANPLAWAIADNEPTSQICNPAFLPPCDVGSLHDPDTRPGKRLATARSGKGI